MDEALDDIGVGGVNLVRNSAEHTQNADGDNSFWLAADELEPGMTYTLSVKVAWLAVLANNILAIQQASSAE